MEAKIAIDIDKLLEIAKRYNLKSFDIIDIYTAVRSAGVVLENPKDDPREIPIVIAREEHSEYCNIIK